MVRSPIAGDRMSPMAVNRVGEEESSSSSKEEEPFNTQTHTSLLPPGFYWDSFTKQRGRSGSQVDRDFGEQRNHERLSDNETEYDGSSASTPQPAIMKRSLAEDDSAVMSHSCGRKLAKVVDHEDITSTNAVNSPLLRLPAEIRAIILRMVVGDQLIHLFNDEGYLARALCCSRITYGCSMASASDLSGTETALEIPPQSFIDAHKACTDVFLTDDEELDGSATDDKSLDLAIFRASQQVYQEVFPLFWRTSRFCLEAGTFVEFSNNLNKIQRDNVKNLVVLDYVVPESCFWPYGRECLYLQKQQAWTLWQGKGAMECPLRNLATFDLHLQFCRGDPATDSTRVQLRAIHTALRVLEKLGNRTLQDVSLTISYKVNPNEGSFCHRLTQQQISGLSTNFRKHLTGSIKRDCTLIDTLAGNVREFQTFMDKYRETMEACHRKGEMSNFECRQRVDRNFEKYADLKDLLRNQLSLEIEDELASLDI